MGRQARDRRLIERLDLNRLASLALIGLGKNAGKTTVLNHILAACGRTGFPRVLALTSVGLDGEGEDRVTGGIKPRVFVKAGDLVATACQSISRSDAVLEILALTGIHTALGQVAIARTRSNGYLELAGPSVANDLALCEELFRREEPDCLFLVDGALDRRSQAGGGLTEAVVLVGGMANAGSMEELAEKTAHQVDLLSLPPVDPAWGQVIAEAMDENPKARAMIGDSQGVIRRVLKMPSLVGHEKELSESLLAGDQLLFLRGAVTERMADALLVNEAFSSMTLVAEDGTRFFLEARSLNRLRHKDIRPSVVHPLVLPMVFVNPVRRDGSLVDGKALKEAVRAVIDKPVCDLGPSLTGQL